MFSNQLLQVTFAISLFVHGLILLQSSNLNPFSPAQKDQKIEVHYVKASPKPGLQRQLLKSDPFLKLDSKVTGSRMPPPYVQRENVFKELKILPNKSADFAKPTFSGPDLTAIKKKISLPPIDMAKIDNPSYINYYQIVREKIRRSAYQNFTHNETGEVYISFIISNDGLIKDVRLVGEKTSANDYLKNIALSSVNDASPFPNFPKELDYPQLSFNIIISFEIE